jgi:hypothetical protein
MSAAPWAAASSNAVSVGGFGLEHDGADPTLQVFFSKPVFAAIRNNTVIKNNLAAFVQSFDTGMAPAVGYARTISATNVTSLSVSNDWTLLETQAAALTNIELIARGTIDGTVRGFLYQPGLGYKPDTTNAVSLTRAQLFAKLQAGARLTFMGVPPGSGLRMGIDRDEDGVLDGDVPRPALQISGMIGNTILHWPYSAAGFNLETAPLLDPLAWTNAMTPWEILAGQNFVTNGTSAEAAYFRLRFQP